MAGYDYTAGMSNNAVRAYERGLVPASKVLGVPADFVRSHCYYVEWHHASSRYNRVEFYDPIEVRATFGLISHPDYEPDSDAIEALRAWKASRKAAAEVYEDCEVEWLEWSGTRNHPRCDERRETGCRVEVKGKTATITLPSGQSFKKRLTTNGFSFARRREVA